MWHPKNRTPRTWAVWIWFAMGVVLHGSAVYAVAETQSTVAPPKIDGKPVEAGVGIFVEEVVAIDEGANTFDAKGLLDIVWHDPRLSFDQAAAPEGIKRYLEEDAKRMIETIWWPDVEFANAVASRERMNEELLISADGRVEYRERFRVSLATNFKMHRFPFDTQQVAMTLESYAWSHEDLVLHVETNLVDFASEYSLPGWSIVGIDEVARDLDGLGGNTRYSDMETTITIRRHYGFFLWKFLVPLTVVMIIISSVLWIPPELIKDRISATLTGILTSVAYGFTISRYLPEQVYDTYLDRVVLLSLFYSAILMLVNVVSYRLHVGQRTTTAHKLDEVSRLIFPCGFLIGLLLLAI